MGFGRAPRTPAVPTRRAQPPPLMIGVEVAGPRARCGATPPRIPCPVPPGRAAPRRARRRGCRAVADAPSAGAEWARAPDRPERHLQSGDRALEAPRRAWQRPSGGARQRADSVGERAPRVPRARRGTGSARAASRRKRAAPCQCAAAASAPLRPSLHPNKGSYSYPNPQRPADDYHFKLIALSC